MAPPRRTARPPVATAAPVEEPTAAATPTRRIAVAVRSAPVGTPIGPVGGGPSFAPFSNPTTVVADDQRAIADPPAAGHVHSAGPTSGPAASHEGLEETRWAMPTGS